MLAGGCASRILEGDIAVKSTIAVGLTPSAISLKERFEQGNVVRSV